MRAKGSPCDLENIANAVSGASYADCYGKTTSQTWEPETKGFTETHKPFPEKEEGKAEKGGKKKKKKRFTWKRTRLFHNEDYQTRHCFPAMKFSQTASQVSTDLHQQLQHGYPTIDLEPVL